MNNKSTASDNYEKLRDIYLRERDRRLRADGLDQYVGVEGNFSSFGDDPNHVADDRQALVAADTDVAIIGGGHSGLLAAYHLLDLYITDFKIIETGGDFGGTWYWNRYPNCRCDVEAAIYLPLIEKFGQKPSDKYIRSSEILAHARRVATGLGLYDKALFQTTVTELRWDPGLSRWLISTDRGDLIRARFVAIGSGPLNRPKLPGIPGIETFKGKAFHTSRWDYSYTGGSEAGDLDGLADKRVAIIGTGATAVQVIPVLGESAKHLYVVQRTPAAVEPRENYAVSDEYWNEIQGPEGWWERRAENFDGFGCGEAQTVDLVDDGWTRSWHSFAQASAVDASSDELDEVSLRQQVDYKKMSEIRNRIDQIVDDAEIAEALKPWYNWFCKRPLFVDGYYETFNRSNVTLVDTRGKSLDRISEDGIVFDGTHYPVDCLIFASGFESAAPSNRSGGFDLIGRDGLSVEEHWKNGMRTLHGLLMHGFPNLLMIHGIKQASTTWNGTYMINKHTRHFATLVRHTLDRGAATFEASEEAEDRWLRTLDEVATADLQFLEDCTPGYINNEGKDHKLAIYAATYGPGPLEYAREIARWRENGGIERDLQFQ